MSTLFKTGTGSRLAIAMSAAASAVAMAAAASATASYNVYSSYNVYPFVSGPPLRAPIPDAHAAHANVEDVMASGTLDTLLAAAPSPTPARPRNALA
jgi:hypothetical protein